MRDKTREKILEGFFAELKSLVKELLERLMLEERKLYLEEHPTKGNGYYTRDLLTTFGPLEDLKVPRVREGDFHPKLLPYRRRTSIELSEAILALYASGASTRDISGFLETVFYLSQSISLMWWKRRSRSGGIAHLRDAIYLDGTFLRGGGNPPRSRCIWPWGSGRTVAGRSWGSGCSGRKGSRPPTGARWCGSCGRGESGR